MLQNRRKSEIKKSAASVLRAADICSLPVDLNKIMERYDWVSLSYDDAQKRGLDTDSSQDGHTIGKNMNATWKYTILYDDTLLPQRIRWTLAHEFGHIMLRHIEMRTLDGGANEEAQYFAEQLLSPIAVVARLGAKTAEDISRICNISAEAAGWRLKDLERHLWYREKYGYTNDDRILMQQFEKFIQNYESQKM